MIDVPIVLTGYGPVGREYAELVRRHRETWARRYGVALRLAAIRTRHAQVELSDDGVVPPRDQWSDIVDLPETLTATGARVFAQAVPSDADGCERAATEAFQALRDGAHVVTATKAHLLSRWSALEESALRAGRAVRISGATGAAMPAGDLARSVLRGFDVRAIRGCLNGTATFVLDRLAHGDALAEAIDEAQRRGIAEADPTADLSGADAATKIRLLTGLLWRWDVASVQVEAEGITAATAQSATQATASGLRLRQVATAEADTPGRVTVAIRAESASGALGALTGPEKAVSYDCGDAGELTVSGGRSSPHGAALAMTKDTLGCALEATSGFG